MTSVDYQWTETEYLELVNEGRFRNTQLISGRIYQNVTPSPEHVRAVLRVRDAMVNLVGPKRVITESPIRADGFPEPDVTVLRRDYEDILATGEHPAPADIRVVIELAGSSYTHDSKVKLPVYQANGIHCFIVSLLRPGVGSKVDPYADDEEIYVLLQDLFNTTE